MIELTRLNSKPLVVNSDLIKFVEGAPDTVLTLISGEKLVVRESAGEVIERIIRFRQSVLAGYTAAAANLHLATSLRQGEESEEKDLDLGGSFGG